MILPLLLLLLMVRRGSRVDLRKISGLVPSVLLEMQSLVVDILAAVAGFWSTSGLRKSRCLAMALTWSLRLTVCLLSC